MQKAKANPGVAPSRFSATGRKAKADGRMPKAQGPRPKAESEPMVQTDSELTQTLAALQQTLAALTDRVASLEARLVAGPHAAADPAVASPPQAAPELASAGGSHPAVAPGGQVDDDREIAPAILLAISAAVAAYLGERAHVRQIRLISSHAWGQQGRVNVQASHALHR